jgi:hypothetical protein
MTSKLGGRPLKGAVITDVSSFAAGTVLTKKDIDAAKRAAKVAKLLKNEEDRKQKEKLESLSSQIEKVKARIGDVPIEKGEEDESDETPGSNSDVDLESPGDEKSAYRMLKHLRYAYKNSRNAEGKKGRERLVALMEADSDFKFFVKELMKIEAALLAAKIRKEGDGAGGGAGQQNFFVVLKGLEDEKKLIAAGSGDKTVDLKQITKAMNPDETSYEPEEAVNKMDVPEQLHKPVEG